MPPKHLLPLTDYERVHMTVYSILNNEEGEPHHACFAFSMLATAILRRHYKMAATVTAGIAGYKIGSGEKDTLVFADNDSGQLRCSDTGFHAWVEADGWVLDFMAPLFPKFLPSPPKMFQRPLVESANDPLALKKFGDFFVWGDRRQTDSLFEEFTSYQANIDLISITEEWYQRPPKKMPPFGIGNQNGSMSRVSLHGTKVVGAW